MVSWRFPLRGPVLTELSAEIENWLQHNRTEEIAQKDFDNGVLPSTSGGWLAAFHPTTGPVDPSDILPLMLAGLSDPFQSGFLRTKWTTISGISQWFLPAIMISIGFSCDCKNEPIVYDEHRWDLTTNLASAITIYPSLDIPTKQVRGQGCSPRVLAHAKLRENKWRYKDGKIVVEDGKPVSDGVFSPVIRDIIQAQFDMIVDVLHNETAIPILESIKVSGTQAFNTTVQDDIPGQRIMRAAGLDQSALTNMRGFLTIRQYALYQALRRGSNDCPVPDTDCGVDGPDRCDRYIREGPK